jgi:hypothetical protein
MSFILINLLIILYTSQTVGGDSIPGLVPAIRCLQEGELEQLAPGARLVLSRVRRLSPTSHDQFENTIVLVMGCTVAEEIVGDTIKSNIGIPLFIIY